ncbi:MAG: thioesterase family protein [Clostridia bacterium]|jgi:acyl-CoA thioester hydrolase|nr:thioesterase family protein [Clostridia bacterium]
MKPYLRKVQYYETDRMGITHHANYVRWMEEARIDFMEQLGFPYLQMEAQGVVSPVKKIECEYRSPCTFGDEITVTVTVEEFNGVVLTIGYEMRNAKTDAVICTARSEHVFLDREGHFVRMKRVMPEFCAALDQCIANRA